MKKLFYLLAVVVAMMLSACGGGSTNSESDNTRKSVDALPEDLQDFVYDLNRMIECKFSDNELSFEKTIVEGNNIVCLYTFNENKEKSLRQLFESGNAERRVREKFIIRVQNECEETNDAIREYKYSIILRITGSRSQYVKDIKISYKEF